MAEEYLSDQEIKRRNTTHRIKVHSLQLGFAVLLMGTWQILADKKILDPFFYGRPTGVLHQLKVWVQNGTSIGSLWVNAWVTFYEATYGFFAGVILGIIFGVFLARNKTAAEIFAPYIKVSNSIPRVVLGSIFVLWLGLGSISKVALAFVLVFFPVFFNAFQGTREADNKLISNARLLGASKRDVLRRVIFPSALSWITASMHVSFGFALIGAIVGEFLGAQRGLGLLIATAQGNFNPNGVYAAMVLIAIMALSAEFLITKLEDRLLNWRPTQVSGSEL
ncbi:MAG: ABC transporter permease [Actinomycetes bacterium]|jgi:NitT/TauT family transport system permease protein